MIGYNQLSGEQIGKRGNLRSAQSESGEEGSSGDSVEFRQCTGLQLNQYGENLLRTVGKYHLLIRS